MPTWRDIAAVSLAGLLTATPARPCSVELVLALDVSRSVVSAEFQLQTGGLAAAFRDPRVIETIAWMPGGVVATVTLWSGPTSQKQSVGWRLLNSPGSIASFADEITAIDRGYFASFTAVGDALYHANSLSASNPIQCQRRVIDISGDGVSNRGRDASAIADALAANGVTINALVIKGASDDPEVYYRDQIVRGPGAFVEVATSFDDYAAAMTRKLLRELAPSMAAR